MEKEFTTYNQQIRLLSERGMIIDTPAQKSYAKRRLQYEGYYNLINGYKTLFIATEGDSNFVPGVERFKQGTTLNDIYALYNFDRKMRELFLKYILILETNVKNLIAYSFGKAHKDEHYLVYTNFNTYLRDSDKKIIALISEIQRQISSRITDPSISHYINNYGYVPIWVLNNILTLGTVSKFYSLMNPTEQSEVSKVFHIQPIELIAALFYLSKVRNFCAHGNRLYCFRSSAPISNTPIHNDLMIPIDQHNEYVCGKRDLFACVIVLKRLLPRNLFNMFIKNLNKLIKNLTSELRVIPVTDVLAVMGFPEDWYQKLIDLKMDT